MNIASFSKRVWAYLIDFLFSLLVPSAGLVVSILFIKDIVNVPAFFVSLMFIAADWLAYTIIFSFWLRLSNGRSLGNLILGLRVVHNDVSKLTYGDCLSRAAMQGLVVLVIINAFYVMVVHTEKSIFDRVTKTVVVDWRNRSN